MPAIHLGPRLLEPATHLIDQRVPDQPLTDLDGRATQLFERHSGMATVVVVRDPECPVSRRYGPRIARLADLYADSFRFVFIYPSVDLSTEQRANDARTLSHRHDSLFVERGSFTLADRLGVRSTGDVFVIDGQQRLRYRGAVDDQYGLGYTRELPTRHYLRNAMDAVHAGREVDVPATSAPGCHIDADPAHDSTFPTVPGGHLLSAHSQSRSG